MTALVMALLAVTPIPVVVLDARLVSGVEAGLATVVTEELARALPPEAFKVTTTQQLATVLGLERQRQLLGCGEETTSCVAEIASALGAEVVTQTTLAKIGAGLRCTTTFIGGRDGATLERVTVDASSEAALLALLHDEVQLAAPRVLAKLRPGHTLALGQPGVRRHAWIPAVVGGALAATGGALFAVTAQNWNNLSTDRMTTDEARALANSGRLTQTLAGVLTGAGAVALAASAAMFAFGAPTDARVLLTPMAGGGTAGLLLTGVLP